MLRLSADCPAWNEHERDASAISRRLREQHMREIAKRTQGLWSKLIYLDDHNPPASRILCASGLKRNFAKRTQLVFSDQLPDILTLFRRPPTPRTGHLHLAASWTNTAHRMGAAAVSRLSCLGRT